MSIYTPAIIAEARALGITPLQAYRNAQAREAIRGNRWHRNGWPLEPGPRHT